MENTERPKKDLSKRHRKRPVVAVAPDGSVAGYFECMTDAAADVGVSSTSIQHAVKSGGFCRKLRWMYEEDYRPIWFEGRTDTLAYNRREVKSRKAAERERNLPPEVKERRSRKKSEYQLKMFRENPDSHLHRLQAAHRRPMRCITTGEEFASIDDFCNRYGINSGNAWKVLNGRRKHVKGMEIEYIKKNEAS